MLHILYKNQRTNHNRAKVYHLSYGFYKKKIRPNDITNKMAGQNRRYRDFSSCRSGEKKKTEIEKTSRALYKSDCCLCKQIGHFVVYASIVYHVFFLPLYVLISVESHYFFVVAALYPSL